MLTSYTPHTHTYRIFNLTVRRGSGSNLTLHHWPFPPQQGVFVIFKPDFSATKSVRFSDTHEFSEPYMHRSSPESGLKKQPVVLEWMKSSTVLCLTTSKEAELQHPHKNISTSNNLNNITTFQCTGELNLPSLLFTWLLSLWLRPHPQWLFLHFKI